MMATPDTETPDSRGPSSPSPGANDAFGSIWLGGWGLISDAHWGERDRTAALDTIRAAVAAGVTTLDTAEMYGAGASESLIGEWLGSADAPGRSNIVVGTKVAPDAMTPEGVRASLTRSLERLRTDVIDLWQTHWSGPQVAIGPVWEAMLRLRDEGFVRAVGVCNAGPKTLDTICAIEPPAINQVAYSPLFRAIEAEIVPRCLERNIGIACYSPFMHGLLTGGYASADAMPPGRTRTRHFRGDRPGTRHGGPGAETLTFDTIARLRSIADEAGRSLPGLTVSWLLARPGVSAVICGASRPDQIVGNQADAAQTLSPDVVSAIEDATNELRSALGSNADLWESDAASRVV